MLRLSRGVTLLELMVVIAIVAILTTLAVGLGPLVDNNRRTALVGDLLSAINFARYQALSRGLPVTLCRSNDVTLKSCGGGTGWENGWIVFVDPGNPGVIDTTGGVMETILATHEALKSRQTVRGTAGVVDRITFNPLGINTGTAGTLLVCDSRGIKEARAIVLSTGGSVKSDTPSATSCP